MYCAACGEPTSAVMTFPVRYDTITGQVIWDKECINPRCEWGSRNYCKRSGGHTFTFFNRKCKKCGYILQSSRIG